jgi:hypothetical protein
LRALPVQQASRGPASDEYAERIESARFGPFDHQWPDATLVSRWHVVLCHLHRRRYAEGVGLSDSDKRSCLYDLKGLARNGRESDGSEPEITTIR